jgi:uncharacterized protein YndB with AHSA1/START domain
LPNGKKHDAIKLETRIHAPVRQVWKAWTDPVLILKWIGSDPSGVGLKAEMDTRPGGKYEISFKSTDGSEHTCFGTYTEMKEFQKLVFSWEWKSEPGVESLVAVELKPDGDYTLMRFQHLHVGNRSMHDYLAGWRSTFEKLRHLLE